MPVAINVHKHEYYRIRHDKTPSPRTTISGIIRGILSIYSRIIFLYPNYPIRHHPINPKNMDLKNLEVSHGGPWWPMVASGFSPSPPSSLFGLGRFMTARNAGSVIAGVTTLLHILDSSPQGIYWSKGDPRSPKGAMNAVLNAA